MSREIEREPVYLARTGEVYSHVTFIDVSKNFEEQKPITLALIKLDDDVMITAQLTDLDQPPEIGDRVEMVTRVLTTGGAEDIIIYGSKFRPIL